MEAEETIFDLTNEIKACRACLATKTKLFNLYEKPLYEAFEEILGNPIFESDELPQHLCVYCREMVLKFIKFRARCQRVQELLDSAMIQGNMDTRVTTELINKIDRIEHKLELELTQANTLTIDTIAKPKNDFMDAPKKGNVRKEFMGDVVPHEYSDSDSDGLEDYEPMFFQNMIPPPIKNEEQIDLNKEKIDQKQKVKEVMEKEPGMLNDDYIDDRLPSPAPDSDHDENYCVIKNAKEEIEKKIKEVKKVDKPILEKDDLSYLTKATKKFCEENDIEIIVLTHEEQMENMRMTTEKNMTKFEFICIRCGSGHKSMENLQDHMRVSHNPLAKIACKICQVRQLSPLQFAGHMRKHIFRYKCKKCNRLFNGTHILKAHVKLGHAATVQKCVHCDKTYTRKATYNSHLQTRHAAQLKNICDMCGEAVESFNGLLRHKKYKHKNIETSEHKCNTCEKRFLSADALSRHHRAIQSGQCLKYSCVQCGATFEAGPLLWLHLVHHYQRGLDLSQHACDKCGTEFLTGEALASHQLVDECYEQHACIQCGNTFLTREILVTHANEQHWNKDVKCVKCNKGFSCLPFAAYHYEACSGARKTRLPAELKAQLRFDVVTEGGQVNIKRVEESAPPPDGVICELCGKVFTKTRLKKHMYYQHKYNKKKSNLKCDICDKTFLTKQTMLDHTNIHTGLRPYNCSICDKTFAGKLQHQLHEMRHLNGRRYVCHICNKVYSTGSSVKKHIRTVHINEKPKVEKKPRPPRVRGKKKVVVQEVNPEPILPDQIDANQLQQILINAGQINQIYGENTIFIQQQITPQTFESVPVVDPTPTPKVRKRKIERYDEDDEVRPSYDEVVETFRRPGNRLEMNERGGKKKPKYIEHNSSKGRVVIAKKKQKFHLDNYQNEVDSYKDHSSNYNETIGAIERIRNIKQSFESAEPEYDDELDDLPEDDLSNGIPEDYLEPSFSRSFVGGKYPVSGKRRPNNPYEVQGTSAGSYPAGGKWPPGVGRGKILPQGVKKNQHMPML